MTRLSISFKSEDSCLLCSLPHAWAVWPNLSFGTIGFLVVVGDSVTSSNGTCSLILPPPPNMWESPRRFFEGLFVVVVVVVCGLLPSL